MQVKTTFMFYSFALFFLRARYSNFLNVCTFYWRYAEDDIPGLQHLLGQPLTPRLVQDPDKGRAPFIYEDSKCRLLPAKFLQYFCLKVTFFLISHTSYTFISVHIWSQNCFSTNLNNKNLPSLLYLLPFL